MEANELMIGCWVWYDNQPYQIRQLGIFGENRDGEDYPAVCIWKPNGIGLIVERNKIEPIPIIPEILEKNGFKADAFTNLSPDYYYDDEVCSVCINLKSTCDKSKSIWVENKKNRFSVTVEESRHSLEKKPLMLHQLQNALRLCGIEKEIII